MAFTLALQCSSNWAMKTHMLRADQFLEFIFTRDRNEIATCNYPIDKLKTNNSTNLNFLFPSVVLLQEFFSDASKITRS